MPITWFDSLRQLLFSPELRIGPPVWPRAAWKALEALASRPPAATADSVPQPATPDTHTAVFAQLGVGLWRLRQRMVQPGTDRPLPEAQKAFRHLQSTWDVLSEAGVRIQDHTDLPFDPGLALKVLTYQPMPGLRREKVIETIKPSIYYKGTLVQMGEVIVGTPERLPNDENGATDSNVRKDNTDAADD